MKSKTSNRARKTTAKLAAVGAVAAMGLSIVGAAGAAPVPTSSVDVLPTPAQAKLVVLNTNVTLTVKSTVASIPEAPGQPAAGYTAVYGCFGTDKLQSLGTLQFVVESKRGFLEPVAGHLQWVTVATLTAHTPLDWAGRQTECDIDVRNTAGHKALGTGSLVQVGSEPNAILNFESAFDLVS